jgi:hypothetical protein
MARVMCIAKRVTGVMCIAMSVTGVYNGKTEVLKL